MFVLLEGPECAMKTGIELLFEVAHQCQSQMPKKKISQEFF